MGNGDEGPALEFARLFKRLRWLAVPVGLAWAAWLCRRSVRSAQQRLENYGPEIFTHLRTPAS